MKSCLGWNRLLVEFENEKVTVEEEQKIKASFYISFNSLSRPENKIKRRKKDSVRNVSPESGPAMRTRATCCNSFRPTNVEVSRMAKRKRLGRWMNPPPSVF